MYSRLNTSTVRCANHKLIGVFTTTELLLTDSTPTQPGAGTCYTSYAHEIAAPCNQPAHRMRTHALPYRPYKQRLPGRLGSAAPDRTAVSSAHRPIASCTITGQAAPLFCSILLLYCLQLKPFETIA